jgi:hypothetical protein
VRTVAGEQIPGVDFRVPRFTYDWEVIDDQHIVIWHTRTRAYLVVLKKSDGCRDLKYERALRLENGVYDLDARTGLIRFENGWCDIESIQKIDVKSLRDVEKSQSKVKVS